MGAWSAYESHRQTRHAKCVCPRGNPAFARINCNTNGRARATHAEAAWLGGTRTSRHCNRIRVCTHASARTSSLRSCTNARRGSLMVSWVMTRPTPADSCHARAYAHTHRQDHRGNAPGFWGLVSHTSRHGGNIERNYLGALHSDVQGTGFCRGRALICNIRSRTLNSSSSTSSTLGQGWRSYDQCRAAEGHTDSGAKRRVASEQECGLW